ncbi:bifunctional tRNA (5-methylaminomethyl-2-thiouridine)(34)-methyltransferase MnmD/FAD-dependent 5-carboxymethylaminomethyl-2-thiouridine(34) oxidoreductase MnmC [Tepidicaulis sp. LMO-SS28]|uniref:bifunctional tRNA (5-methylaminomethyl-2-thiouridine)(34)-methyltransferase MnmD/FAD-dependent 5-carboxymethylaminomethyl-2-thiouridine(34) oxidoreductase MnmC n=1 Tax=Tepidicaulis sp. LMO-SS28 TaxID=3447455 RepID=UPI003EDF2196
MTGDPHRLPAPRLAWREDGSPESTDFGDLYFSAEDGPAETAHVFLKGNGLPEAWAGRRSFTIGETGFGTGLNFLCLWALWREARPESGQLHFVSVEGFPLSAEELARAHQTWPQFAALSAQLLAAYPPRVPGFHTLHLEDGVTLTLLFGEAAAELGALELAPGTQVDAWFLDGFAPSKNETMWSADVVGQMARLSGPGTTLATFTVAGAVRRGLKAAGFATEKTPGFGRKREMLRGTYQGAAPASLHAPWQRLPERPAPSSVLVIGGGIAGASLAYALKRRGAAVQLLERGPAPGHGASGNPAALFMPRPALGTPPPGLFHRAAYLHALRFYGALERESGASFFTRCGALQLAENDKEEERFRAMEARHVLPPGLMRFCGAEEASRLAGVPIHRAALHFPQAGLLGTHALLAALLEGVPCRFEAEVARLQKRGGLCQALGRDGEVLGEAAHVVLATGAAIDELGAGARLPVQHIAGQVTAFVPTASTAPLQTALAFGAYLLPAQEGMQLTGASFIKGDLSTAPTAEEDKENLAALSAMGFEGAQSARLLSGRRSVRAATPDRMPLAGPLPDAAAFEKAYAGLRSGNLYLDYSPAPWEGGLSVLGTFGSRGFLTAPLASEELAAQLTGGVSPLPRAQQAAVSPARFLIRGLRRGA